MAVAVPLTGGCACGAIRYACTAAPMFTWKCHCRDCQRSTGGGAAVNVVFSASAVQFTQGAPKEYTCTGTSGAKTHRGVLCGMRLPRLGPSRPDPGDPRHQCGQPGRARQAGTRRRYLDGECPAVGRVVFDSAAVRDDTHPGGTPGTRRALKPPSAQYARQVCRPCLQR